MRSIGTTGDFKLVAYTIAVGIVQQNGRSRSRSGPLPCNRTRLLRYRHRRTRRTRQFGTAAVIVGGVSVVVACGSIGTTGDFKLVAYTIAVGIVQANAVAVISSIWELTHFRSSWRYACVLEVEEDAVVGVRVSVDEYLNVEGTGEHAVGSDLCEEYLLVVTGHAVGVSVEDEPSTADGVIDGEVSTCFEVASPRVDSRFNGVDVSFSCCGFFCKADGDIGVISGFGEEGEEGGVLIGTEESTERTLIEVTGRLNAGWELGVTGYARDEVVAVLRLDVDTVGDVSVEVTAVVHLVGLHDEAVVISRPLGVVTCFGIDADGLEARSIVVCSERIVVGRSGVGTSCDFKFVTYAVAVSIVQANTVAIVAGIGEVT